MREYTPTTPLSLAEQKRQLVREKLVRELGPVIMGALADPGVIEIMLNPDGALWVDVLGQGMRDTGTRISPAQAENLLGTIAAMLGVTIDAEHPTLQGELPIDGSRVQGVMRPVVRNPVFAIRKRAALVYTLDDYVAQGVLDPGHAEALKVAVRSRDNILIVGSTGSGKTTLANALLHEISCVAGTNQRIVIIEDTVELQCSAPNVVSMRTSDDVDTTNCLKLTMRLRPDRIVVGEVRDHAALALLKAWNTGHPGGLCTVHANGAAAKNIQPQPILIAEAVNLIAFITRTSDGRRVTEMLRTNGVANGRYVLENVMPTHSPSH
jgi:P-type conjugative transfer ATPase TrbB